jgi:GAF domain-containing protein
MTSPAEARAGTVVEGPPELRRLDAVRRYDILDTPPDGAFDRVAELAAGFFDVPVSTVSIVDEDRVWFKATHGLDGVTQVGTESGLCTSVVTQDSAYVVPDALVDPRTIDHPLVTSEFGLRFYAAAPVITHDGYRIGTVTVIDFKPRQIQEKQQQMLHHLAGVVMDELELRLASLRAVSTERQLREQAEREQARVQRMNEMLEKALRRKAAARGERHPCTLLGEDYCGDTAEFRIADLTGLSAWACMQHAGEALATVPGTFVATDDAPSIASLRRR